MASFCMNVTKTNSCEDTPTPSITIALDNIIYMCTLIKNIKHALTLFTISMLALICCCDRFHCNVNMQHITKYYSIYKIFS